MTAIEISSSLKKEIQGSYSRWLASHDFKPRYGQRVMIAHVARALVQAQRADKANNRFAVVEAGTGIGKTVAYTLAAAPIARELGKTLVISTATVALQEQLINKDLPDLIERADIDMTFGLAKGRGRYLCLSKLDNILRSVEEKTGLLNLYPDEVFESQDAVPDDLYRAMSERILSGEWNGDRDDWPDALEERDWRVLTSDRSQCHNRRCTWVTDCCFFKAREQLQEVDCIVTNHDLVLADLALGGGAILPEPEECLFVFDEGHHLADKAVQHFSSGLRVSATERWCQQLGKTMDAMQNQWTGARRVANSIEQVRAGNAIILLLLGQLPELLETDYAIHTAAESQWRKSEHARYPLGEVPDQLRQLAHECQEQFGHYHLHLSAINDAVQDELEAEPGSEELEQWLPLLGSGVNRAAQAQELFSYFYEANIDRDVPRTFWISRREHDVGVDYGMHCAPLLARNYLQEMLWSRCAASVLTSATLTALGEFDRLQQHSGLPPEAAYEVVPSPFDYANRAVLRVPATACLPSNVELHTQNLLDYIELLADEERAGVLILFMSRRQMQDVHDGLRSDLLDLVLLQDQRSKQGLLDEHAKRVRAGNMSMIFGLASFAEGVDLPGDLCRHVVIAKLPFSVPDAPVASALTEWVEAQGRNAFMEVSVPDAALRLVQACGRLMRSEQDSGVVTLFDSRVVEKRYGRELLDALPPFQRDIQFR